MLHIFAETYPFMAIAIAFVASFYVTGVCLLVMAIMGEHVWFEDSNGVLHYVSHT